MANEANAPAEVFREYRLMKRRWTRRMGGEWVVVDGRETFVCQADGMSSLHETPYGRSGSGTSARTVESTGGILLTPSETTSSGTSICTPNDDESDAGSMSRCNIPAYDDGSKASSVSRYSIPDSDSFDQSTIKDTEAAKEQKRSMCEQWLSVTYL